MRVIVHEDGFKSGTICDRSLKLSRRLRVNVRLSFFVHTKEK